MVINTGSRTDIPAYYSDWFYNRIREGYVLVRNPYYHTQVTRYRLSPDVVDAIVFCTKNPEPMISRLMRLAAFDMFWFVTVTPYGKEIEPYVPDKERVLASFRKMSSLVGRERISWRYDPVFVTEAYSVAVHIQEFQKMAEVLKGYTKQCVVSFIDLYEKTKRNFPGIRSVTGREQECLIDTFSKIAKENKMQMHLCCEDASLVRENVDADGCLSKAVMEKALGCRLDVPNQKAAREACSCLLGADIGAYNTCGHGCLYCYANYDRKVVEKNRKHHDAKSPLLTGNIHEDDIIKQASQKSWRNGQMNIFDIIEYTMGEYE